MKEEVFREVPRRGCSNAKRMCQNPAHSAILRGCWTNCAGMPDQAPDPRLVGRVQSVLFDIICGEGRRGGWEDE